jgi:hypothetical protein
LKQNYPNPFNSNTTIQYTVAVSGPVQLTIYNVLGQGVAMLVDEYQEAGTYRVIWDAREYASGVYFCRFKAGDFVKTKKMVLLK